MGSVPPSDTAASQQTAPSLGRDAFTLLATHGHLPGRSVELRFVPVHDLQRHRVTTFFCTPALDATTGYQAFENIAARDLPFIDRAILAHAVKFARKLAGAGTVATIGTSVHFETLASPKGREIYQHALEAAGVADHPFLILNVEEIPAGVAAAQLVEAVSAVRGHVKRVFLRLSNMETSVLPCGDLGISGLTMTLPPHATRVAAMGIAKWLLRECEAQSAHSCIDRIDSEETLELMTLAGIHFGAGPQFGTEEFRGDARPEDVEAYLAEHNRAETGERRKSSTPDVAEHLQA
jgi:hypothetical protein